MDRSHQQILLHDQGREKCIQWTLHVCETCSQTSEPPAFVDSDETGVAASDCCGLEKRVKRRLCC